jgi:hypothetical protein
MFVPFWMGSFLWVERKRGPISGLVLQVLFLQFVKDIVYCEKVQNLNELCYRILRAVKFIDNELLANTWPGTEYHLYVCHATNGAHI